MFRQTDSYQRRNSWISRAALITAVLTFVGLGTARANYTWTKVGVQATSHPSGTTGGSSGLRASYVAPYGPVVLPPSGFVAWPPPGYVPRDLMPRSFTFRMDEGDASAATITVKDGQGTVLNITRTHIALPRSKSQGSFQLPTASNVTNGIPVSASDLVYDVTISGIKPAQKLGSGGTTYDPVRSYSYRVTVIPPITN